MTTQSEVRIAGVPWPRYKVASLAAFGLVFLLVGVVTMSAAAAVLSAAAVGTFVWVTFGALTSGAQRPM